MNKNKLRWLWRLSTVAILCLSSVILYKYIVHSDLYWDYRDILSASSNVSYFIIFTVCFFAVVDAIAFAIGYSMLQKLKMLASWEFAVYFAVIIAGNIMIVFLLSPMATRNFSRLVLPAFILLTSFNFAVSEIFFDESIKDAFLIGMLISLVNTLIGIMFIPGYD